MTCQKSAHAAIDKELCRMLYGDYRIIGDAMVRYDIDPCGYPTFEVCRPDRDKRKFVVKGGSQLRFIRSRLVAWLAEVGATVPTRPIIQPMQSVQTVQLTMFREVG